MRCPEGVSQRRSFISTLPPEVCTIEAPTALKRQRRSAMPRNFRFFFLDSIDSLQPYMIFIIINGIILAVKLFCW